MSIKKSNNLIPLLTSTFRGRKVLVTGHTGFKGSWLCQWLIWLGAEVSGFSLPDPPTKPSLFEQLGLAARLRDVRGDVRDSGAVREWMNEGQPDYVFHMAAQPLVRDSYRDPKRTWETNVMGTIHVLEALRTIQEGRISGSHASRRRTPESINPKAEEHAGGGQAVAAVMITTDKVYRNQEWVYGYREADPLGGHDPYSSSKAAAELAIDSWRKSFFPDGPVRVASARAGNVIGGGDWAADRIVPDAMRALAAGGSIPVRSPNATRPWQHVLEPLSGYLQLAGALGQAFDPGSPSRDILCSAFNFGPGLESNRPVRELVGHVCMTWDGTWEDRTDPQAPHEAIKLDLASDKAFHVLGWQPQWDFSATVARTVEWYRSVYQGADPVELTHRQIQGYCQA